MRFLAFGLVVCALLSLSTSCSSRHEPGVAVIELFTSQGCSMCPAADKHLSDLIHGAETDSLHIYGLSFHVDYWDSRGWKDPNSKKMNTDRQEHYSMLLHTGGMYTPEMIVNGATEFVGSDRKAAQAAIKQSLSKAAAYEIAISDLSLSDSTMQFHYIINRDPDAEDIINIALVQRDVENFVPSGENEGKALHHDNVVKLFQVDSLKKEAAFRLALPQMDISKGRLILYIQDRHWRVQGATSIKLQS